MSKKDRQVEPVENGNGAAVGGTIPEATSENVPEVSQEAKDLATEFGKSAEEVQKQIDALLQEPAPKRGGAGRTAIERVPGEELRFHKGTSGALAIFEARMAGNRKSPTEPKKFRLIVTNSGVRCEYMDKKGTHGFNKKPADLSEAGWKQFAQTEFVSLRNLPIK